MSYDSYTYVQNLTNGSWGLYDVYEYEYSIQVINLKFIL